MINSSLHFIVNFTLPVYLVYFCFDNSILGLNIMVSFFVFFCHCFRIAYSVVQMATQSGKNVYLTVTKESGNSIVHLFKMISTRAASGLYRAITETHAFYRFVFLDVCVCVRVCAHIYIYIPTHLHINTYTHTYTEF